MPTPTVSSKFDKKSRFFRATTVASLLAGMIVSSHAAHADTYTWKGTGSGLFNLASNWLPAGIPVVGDTVVLTSNAVLTVTNNLNISRLVLGPGSVLQGTGTVTVTDYLSVQDASLLGSGTLVIGPDAIADFSSPTPALLSLTGSLLKNNKCKKPIVNAGTLNLLSGDLVLGANLVNDVDGTLHLRGDGSITRDLLTKAAFVNEGTVLKSGGKGTSGIETAFINNGIVRSLSGTLDLGASYQQDAGSLSLDGGNLSASGPITISGGKLGGSGVIDGDVVNNENGHVGPGYSPGSIIINGNYTQTGNGSLDIEIGGTTPGTQFDQLTVNGTANLGGMLNITQYGSYVPQEGSNFEILDYYSNAGNFATVNFQFPSSPLTFTSSLTPMYLIVTARKPDSSLPTAMVTTPGEETAVTTLSNATGTASDSNGIKSVTVQLYRYGNASTAPGFWGGGTTWTSSYSATTNERVASGTTNWTIAMPALAYGEYSLRPTAKDGTDRSSLSDSTHFLKTNGSSSIGVSSSAASASGSTISLRFTGALDSRYAVDFSRYDVIRLSNGQPISIQSITYNSSTNTVTLNLLGGTLRVGDKLSVGVINMFDSTGKLLPKLTAKPIAG